MGTVVFLILAGFFFLLVGLCNLALMAFGEREKTELIVFSSVVSATVGLLSWVILFAGIMLRLITV